MKTIIYIPDDYSGQAVVTSTGNEVVELRVSKYFNGSVNVNSRTHTVTVVGSSSKFTNLANVLTTTSIKALQILDSISTTSTVFTQTHKLVLLIDLILFGAKIMTALKTNNIIEGRVKNKILEERRHSKIQFLVERQQK